MPLDLQRLVGPIKIQGTQTDPIYVIVNGISIITFDVQGAVTAVAGNTKTTIVSQAFVAGSLENIVLVSMSGTNQAKFFFTVNGVDVDIRRSAPGYNEQFDFTGAPYALTTGDVVDIKVEHFGGGAEDFEATIYGYPA